MTPSALETISIKTRRDAEKLNDALDTVDTINKIFLWIIAIAGVIFSFAAAQFGGPIAFIMVALSTAIVCALVYLVAILSTHVAKVLSNNSILSLGILENQNREHDKLPAPQPRTIEKTKTENSDNEAMPTIKTIKSLEDAITLLKQRGMTLNSDTNHKYIVQQEGISRYYETDESLINFAELFAKSKK